MEATIRIHSPRYPDRLLPARETNRTKAPFGSDNFLVHVAVATAEPVAKIRGAGYSLCADYVVGVAIEDRGNRSKSACTGLSVSDLKSSSLAGYFCLIQSNLCTRHIQKKLTPRGHHDWPDKLVIRPRLLRQLPLMHEPSCYAQILSSLPGISFLLRCSQLYIKAPAALSARRWDGAMMDMIRFPIILIFLCRSAFEGYVPPAVS